MTSILLFLLPQSSQVSSNNVPRCFGHRDSFPILPNMWSTSFLLVLQCGHLYFEMEKTFFFQSLLNYVFLHFKLLFYFQSFELLFHQYSVLLQGKHLFLNLLQISEEFLLVFLTLAPNCLSPLESFPIL